MLSSYYISDSPRPITDIGAAFVLASIFPWATLRAIIDGLAKHGTLLLIVDQPATIGTLPVAVAQGAGILVGYLPGLAMRRIADLHPGEAKTDLLTEPARSTRGNRIRSWLPSSRFCSCEQRRERSAVTTRAGGAAVRFAGGHRQSFRTISVPGSPSCQRRLSSPSWWRAGGQRRRCDPMEWISCGGFDSCLPSSCHGIKPPGSRRVISAGGYRWRSNRCDRTGDTPTGVGQVLR